MEWYDLDKLLADVAETLVRTQLPAAILGNTSTARLLLGRLDDALRGRVIGIFGSGDVLAEPEHGVPVLPVERLADEVFGAVIVAADRQKETLLEAATPFLRGQPKVLVSGYGHYDFKSQPFHRILGSLEVPSLANGYPHTLPHLYQCLENAARLGLEGAVAEFGAFRGGTTMFLARAIRNFAQNWKVYAFDTFTGFPGRRSLWDMYDHPDLYDTDVEEVRAYLAGENVEIIQGDIVETAGVLKDQPMVLSFIDTDNYTPAMAALEVVQKNTVVGGAIVFDHFTGENRFRYTLGERQSAWRLVEDPRYFNLHGTGVFYRQR